MKISDRDLAIIHFINDFGFCEMPHLDKRFGFKKPRNYQVMNRLTKAGLVKHERVFHARHGIFRLTHQGAKFTELPPLFKIPLGNYAHDVTLLEVYLKLRQQHPEAEWISERQLKRDKFFDGVGKHGHVADGILAFPEGKRVAVEIELSLKGKNRVERILKGYGAQFGIEEVWYYCAASIVPAMRSLAAKMPFIKINHLKELLG